MAMNLPHGLRMYAVLATRCMLAPELSRRRGEVGVGVETSDMADDRVEICRCMLGRRLRGLYP